MISKINSWLDEQKKGMFPYKAANVDLLKENLEYSGLKIEQSGEGEKIIILPITEKFKAQKITDKSSIPNLVLIMSSSGDIKKGNIVLFKPKTKGYYSKVPENTFYNIFNTANVDCDGLFQFLSVAGWRRYQLEYKDGNLYGFGLIKNNKEINRSSRTNTCYEWYLITTYYNADGSVDHQTEEFIGVTCDNGGSGPNPDPYESSDPDNPGGGSMYCNETEWSSGVTGATDLESSIIESEASTTRTKTYVWVFAKGTFNPSLKWKSHETGVHIKENDLWKWQSLTHNSVSKVGMVIGGSLQCDVNSATPTVGVYNAIMAIDYTFTWSFVCGGSPISNSSNHTSAKPFNVND